MEPHRLAYKEQLGMDAGSAQARLKRMLFFDLVVRVRGDLCCRCGLKIESFEDLGIEHKQPWRRQENGADLFWDIENIDYCHKRCNLPDPEHLRYTKTPEHRAKISATLRARF